MSIYIQRAVINSKLHLNPCVKIVDKSLYYLEKYPDISILLENPIEKVLEDPHRSYHADPSSMTEISLMFLKEGDLVDIMIHGDYPVSILNECAGDLQELLEYSWDMPAGEILKIND
jgi:hypothetical protein